MPMCAQCRAEIDRYYNLLSQCQSCHNKTMLNLNSSFRTMSEHLEYWMKECEKRYTKTIYYSDQPISFDYEITGSQLQSTLSGLPEQARNRLSAQVTANNPNLTGESLVKLGALPQAVRRNVKDNGTAQGFISKSKDFTPLSSEEKAKCIRNFIVGRLTVCECENMMRAVFLNAICDVVGDTIFNIVFSKFQLSGAGDCQRFAKEGYWNKFDSPSEESIQPGDWVYISRSDKDSFANNVMKSRAGGASTGWNLLCTRPGEFMGFGLSDKDSQQGKTLKQCYAKANEGITFTGSSAAQAEQAGSFFIAARYQLDQVRLKEMVETRLTKS